ncbi:MAG: ADP-ribosylglycohydrolase family protein [Desulfobacterales bacterium]|nr:ADP-ribosylglycohydrolase family protein [Desulfobacterales bacterium]
MIHDYQAIPWDDSIDRPAVRAVPGALRRRLHGPDLRRGHGPRGHRRAGGPARPGLRPGRVPALARQPGRPLQHPQRPPAAGLGPLDRTRPHADDIDFQIEADFAGLMSPGLVNAGAADLRPGRPHHELRRRLVRRRLHRGHVQPGLRRPRHRPRRRRGLEGPAGRSRASPAASGTSSPAYRADPSDWKKAWFAVERRWAEDIGCPDFVFEPGNIDARVNGAYVVIGLLYGNGDFGRTLQIATRCGQDSDCNPASAGGILGTWLGYDGHPRGLAGSAQAHRGQAVPVHDRCRSIKVYETGLAQALEVVRANGGTVDGETVRVPAEAILPVRLETSFPGSLPRRAEAAGPDAHGRARDRLRGHGLRSHRRTVQDGRGPLGPVCL